MSKALLSDQPLWEKLIKKWFWLYLFSFLVAPAGYLIKIIISNSVSVADVWVLYTIVSLITLLSIYNDLGLTESLQYFLPRYRVKKQYNHVKTSIYLSLFSQLFTGLIIAVILWFAAPWLSVHYFQSPDAVVILRYFCFYFLGINLFQILQSIFYAFQNTFAYQFVDFVRMWSVVGFTLFFFLTDRAEIQRYSLNRVLGVAVWVLVALIIFLSKYKKSVFQWKFVLEKPMLKEYLKYAFWCFLGLNTAQIFGQVIQQLIIVILGPESAGYYTNFLSLFWIVSIVVWPIVWFIFPLVSELISKNDKPKLKLLFRFFYTYFSVFAFAFAMFLTVLGPEIALTIFSKSFVISGKMLSLGGMFSVFSILVGFNFSVLAGIWKIKERVKMMFIAVISVIIFAILGLNIFGVYGAVLALGLSYLLLFLMSFSAVYRFLKFDVDWKFIIKNIILSLILAVGLYLIKSDLPAGRQGLFVFENLYRYDNLWKIVALGLIYFAFFVVLNWKRFALLKGEVVRMRK